MRYLTPRKRAEGLGAARHGTGHHIAMTVSGWALLFIVPVFVFVLARTLGQGYEAVRDTFANPFVAILTGLFLFVGMRHFAKGAQMAIEDYAHGFTREALVMLANAVAYLVIAVGFYALIKLAL
ncbi:succinate dehydrogenase subunit D [Gemmobacter megaterium]|uniref:Succinate dehydrogenase hydrophobic membrane anchor subunit n=1 Tax=Gemmobacter megaterium TaxID=1086013 RepID=A0A1N7NSS2_9RHOB|nr:succinate dehydrogenase, hydrophobic membrane anchor protein [Gemmobacter megaterium]GGE16808.1 succinate dehydrogenase [Gemmobacter megaterium]SIT01384.1 succinate dehydrogenase subunit D [Gemmobacter megaterium]